MIDVSEILADFEEVNVETLATEYGITDERASISVSLYNKALVKMRVGSYDTARIDLRKSVNMYPNFVEARMLLGVCVFSLGERTEAVAIFNTIKGSNRERALGYLDKLQELSTRPESASFKSAGRQNRVSETPYATESKLDAIMRSAPSKTAEKDDFDDDLSSAFDDDDTDMTVAAVPKTDDTVEKIVETDMSYVRETVARSGADGVAPYGSMRRRPVRREVPETNDQPMTDISSEETSSINTTEETKSSQTKKNPDKASETIAKANRTISNLRIQKARVTVLAMGMGLCCLILLIIVICFGVSNSNLRDELDALKNNGPATDYTPNINGTNSPVQTPSQTAGTDDNSANNTSPDSAMTAYNNAKSLFDEGKFLEAADLLAVTDLTVLGYNDRTAAETLYKDAVNKFSTEYNNQMLGNIVPPENWSAVIEYGLPVYRHNIENENPDFTGNGASLCFHIGKAYEMTGDKEKAKEFYNITMSKFAGNNYADYAKSRLSGIE